MTAFFDRHSDKIKGIFSCLDRLVIQGTFPEICFPGAITTFFYMHGIKIFDFKKWAAPMRDEINETAKRIAQKNSIEIEFTDIVIYKQLMAFFFDTDYFSGELPTSTISDLPAGVSAPKPVNFRQSCSWAARRLGCSRGSRRTVTLCFSLLTQP